MRIEQRRFSPACIDKIVFLDAHAKSSASAKAMLLKSAEISVSTSVIRELSTMIGSELQQDLEKQAARNSQGLLSPEKPEPPSVVSVAVDGGRILTRELGGRGVHEPQWKESKQACLLTLSSEEREEDPHPALPGCFANKAHVEKIVKEVHSRSAASHSKEEAEKPAVSEDFASLLELPDNEASTPSEPSSPGKSKWRPKRLVRTCIGTMACSRDFGPLVASEAKRRGFYKASRRAFLGDGLAWNWTIQRTHFPDFVPILDFIHPVGYIYKAAQAMSPNDHWAVYIELITQCWQGNVGGALKSMRQWLSRQPVDPDDLNGKSPRAIVETCVTYLENNQTRMDYPKYRRTGLPCSTSSVESLIKEVNFRTKGTEKFWNRPEGADAILAVRSACLGDDDKLSKWILSRPGSPHYRPTTPKTAA